MLIFWEGKGWTVPLIMFGWIFFMVGVVIATLPAEGDPNADANTNRVFAIAFALSAATVFFMDRRRSRKRREQAASDAAEGAGAIAPRDSFMFIALKYWAYVFAAVTVYFIGHSFTV